jgi:hypothetical protein
MATTFFRGITKFQDELCITAFCGPAEIHGGKLDNPRCLQLTFVESPYMREHYASQECHTGYIRLTEDAARELQAQLELFFLNRIESCTDDLVEF